MDHIFRIDLFLISISVHALRWLIHLQPQKYQSLPTLSYALDCSLHSAPWFAKLAPRVHFSSILLCHTVGLWLDGLLMTLLMGTHRPIYRCSHAKHVTNYKLVHDISHTNKKRCQTSTESTIDLFFFLSFFYKRLLKNDLEGKSLDVYILFFNLTSPWKLWAKSLWFLNKVNPNV